VGRGVTMKSVKESVKVVKERIKEKKKEF